MKTKIEEINGQLVAVLDGEFDTAAAADVEEALQPLYANNEKDIVMDCTTLEYIASSGLRILLAILKKAKSSGHRMVLKNVNEDIMSVFRMTGFVELFEFEQA
ncbi:MAG: STAS domain-containing protein [Bacteroidales bacterium]|nr:STAS domain-containing protein [Bacteroidaceae bacterium]MDO4185618.1 STAS domain-containing protein [Bacteroidales bacterium]